MKIAIDYDKTYTLHPDFWDAVISAAKTVGHEVVCVTARYPNMPIKMICDVIYTCHRAKHMVAEGIDVWIDDEPVYIYLDHDDADDLDALYASWEKKSETGHHA